MKKQEIKKDIIREKIVDTVRYMSENSQNVWIVLIAIIAIIVAATFFSNANNKKISDSNLRLGMMQNRAIDNDSDSLLILDYKKILDNPMTDNEYNQAFIFIISNAIKSNNDEYVRELLSDNNFSSDDGMLNSFIYRAEAIFLYSDNLDKYASLYKKAIKVVPSYDLKINWSTELIDIYIDNSEFDEAKITLNSLNEMIDNEDELSLVEKNNLKFIKSKIDQLMN